MPWLHRALSMTIIAAFAMIVCAPDADAKKRRGHRVKVYAVNVHAVPIAPESRSHRRIFWVGPYGMVPARSYGPMIGGAFAFGAPPAASQALAMGGAPETVAQLCRQEATGSPEETTARLASTIEATPAQQDALAELRAAMEEAARFLRDTCPTDVPLDPITRFNVLQKQLATMRRSVEMLKPSLAKFEQSLSEEQRARLSGAKNETDHRADGQPAGGEICDATAAITRLPVERIARTVRPRGEQREALVQAFAETARAADILARNCPMQVPTTPLARLEGMERQLNAANEAVETVILATRDFYDTLRPEQKARFDRLNSRHAMRRLD
jgi:hypothetical protein